MSTMGGAQGPLCPLSARSLHAATSPIAEQLVLVSSPQHLPSKAPHPHGWCRHRARSNRASHAGGWLSTLSPITPCIQHMLNEEGRTQCASPAPWPPASLVPTCTLDVGWLGICLALLMLTLASVSPLEESCLYPSPPLCHSSAAVKKKTQGCLISAYWMNRKWGSWWFERQRMDALEPAGAERWE